MAMSPVLFLSDAKEEFGATCNSVQLGTLLQDLDLADDIYLLAHIRGDMEVKLRRFAKYVGEVTLKINVV